MCTIKFLLNSLCGYGMCWRNRKPQSCISIDTAGRNTCIALLIGFAVFAPTPVIAQVFKSTYPRIGAIEIASAREATDPAYRQILAKHDILILGMWRNYSGIDTATNERLSIRDIVIDIKGRAAAIGNDGILVGKYTMFMESGSSQENTASSDKREKLNSEVGPGYPVNNDWWARKRNGEHTSSYRNSWNTNITEHVQRDSNGDTWPEWAVSRDYREFFRDIPELDIWFIDNWFYKPRVTADWNGDGVDDDKDSEIIRQDYRQGFVNGLRRARELAPGRIFMGNVDGDPQMNQGLLTEPEYTGQISALYEGAIGKSWSRETWATWKSMMNQYQTTLANARDRLLIMTVHGEATDYALMRYGLASCLMDDGYYYYTTFETEYRSALWFDEYDVKLGLAIDPPQFSPWQQGVYRRRFQNGMVLVNPKDNGSRTVQIEPGYNRLSGQQDRVTNNGQPVSSLTLAARDGIILINDQVPGEQMRPKPPILNLSAN